MVPLWWRNSGAVMRYWKRRCTWSLTRISSGSWSPEPSVTVRVLPSTWQSTMPGNHSGSRAASPTSAQTSAAGRRMRTSWRIDPSAITAPSSEGRRQRPPLRPRQRPRIGDHDLDADVGGPDVEVLPNACRNRCLVTPGVQRVYETVAAPVGQVVVREPDPLPVVRVVRQPEVRRQVLACQLPRSPGVRLQHHAL